MFMKKYIEEKAQEFKVEQLVSLAESTIEHNVSLIDQLDLEHISKLSILLSNLEKSKEYNIPNLFDERNEFNLKDVLAKLEKDKGLLAQAGIEIKTVDEYKACSKDKLVELIKQLQKIEDEATSRSEDEATSSSASKKQKTIDPK